VGQIDTADSEPLAAACSQVHSLTLQGAVVRSPALFPQLATTCTQLKSLTLISLIWFSPDVAASVAALGTGLPELQELAITNLGTDAFCGTSIYRLVAAATGTGIPRHHTDICARLTIVQVVGANAAAGRHMSALL
jgi:hypothetical protein